ncbi:MAG: S-formylglutathione hydrolase [Cyanothece sp. SIO2G6]|nr:S-formylglutathione hydrolase [Cyanothece sp. SIO2G6]
MSTTITSVSHSFCFGGIQGTYQHHSRECDSTMTFAVYQPPQAKLGPVPVLYFLSGLTCTEENFTVKAGAQHYAAQHGLMLVVPDTSPRNTGIPGEDDQMALGTGAGFYLDAIEEPWSRHYRMYSYVVSELPQVIAANFPIKDDRQSIFGHSMGGHGALVCALRNPDQYRSVSALAPIAALSQCEWGKQALLAYLGPDQSKWQAYDASEVVKTESRKTATNAPLYPSILIDQGSKDPFLAQNQLLPEAFEAACAIAGQPLTLRKPLGYDHGYFFIATFIEDHIRYHAEFLSE